VLNSKLLYDLGLTEVYIQNDFAWGIAPWQFNEGYSAVTFIEDVTQAGLEIVTATPRYQGMLVTLRQAPVYAPITVYGGSAAEAAHV
jgi:hypothetical protein